MLKKKKKLKNALFETMHFFQSPNFFASLIYFSFRELLMSKLKKEKKSELGFEHEAKG